MFNTAMYYLGWLTITCVGWFLGMLLYEFIKDDIYTLYWKRRAKTLSYKLYVHGVTMMVIPIGSYKFMISFKCDGYEDWIFYITATSWKEIGAAVCQRWGNYFTEREPVIELVGDPKEIWGEVCKTGFRPATDGGENLDGKTGQTEEELD